MSVRLKEAIFRVKCREPGCSFSAEFAVKENIMAATEAEVDSEAIKLARNMGFNRHDAIHGRKHPLANPDVAKVSASYEHLGTGPAPAAAMASGAPTRTFRRGEVIIRKGQSAVTVCEVVRGTAMNEKLPDLVYREGATFGSAAIFRQKNRMADIVAGEDDTVVAFYNIREMRKTNPARAGELFEEAMEDLFLIIGHLEGHADALERKVKLLESRLAARAVAAKAAAKKPTRKAVKKAAKKAAPKKAGKKPAKKAARKAAKRRR